MKKPFLIPLFLFLVFVGKLYAQAPVITSFSPASGAVGTVVTITGKNFNATAANNIVFFGGVMAVPTSATATSIQVKVPVGASYQQLTVLNLPKHLSGYAAKPFDVTFAGVHKINTTEFDPKFLLPQGILPAAVNLVDMDMDGKPDLVVGCLNTQDVSVYRNIGSKGVLDANSFAAKVSYSFPYLNPVVTKVMDVDGDGKPDVIVDFGGGSFQGFEVLHNSSTPGNVSLDAPVIFDAGGFPLVIAIGDVDGDGKPDVVALTQTKSVNMLSVFKNTSSGGVISSTSFNTRTDLGTNTTAIQIALSDIDADGKPDIILLNGNQNTISLMRNTSTGANIAFDAKVDFAAGMYPSNVATADLDGDGKPDLVVGNANATFNAVSVYLNKSVSGSFTAASLAPKVDLATVNNAPATINIADMDGDGKPEILIGNRTSGAVSIFHNKAVAGSITTSSFESKVDVSVQILGGYSFTINAIGVGDIDGDGRPDMVIIGDSVAIYRNNPRYPPIITGFSPNKATIGKTVTITGENFNTNALSNTVYFGPVQAKVVTASATQLTVTIPAGVTYGTFSVFNTATRLTAYSPAPFIPIFTSKHKLSDLDFEPKVSLAKMQNISGISFHDIDGDGRLDMVVSNYNVQGYIVASVYRNVSASGNLSAASFPTSVDFATHAQPQSAMFKDLNGDGKPDMIIFNKGQAASVYLNKAVPGVINNASFLPKIDLGGATAASDVTFADLDGDGRPDMITTAGPNVDNYSFAIARNASAGGRFVFDDNIRYYNVVKFNTVTTADINGDGMPDIAMAGVDSTVSIYQNKSVNGNIILGDKVDFSIGRLVSNVKLADLNGDGKPDMIVTYRDGSNEDNFVSVYRNISTGGAISAASFAAPVNFSIGNPAIDLSIADIDGDGKPDIVFNDNAASVLLNNSTTNSISFNARVNLTNGLSDYGGPDYGTYLSVFDLDGDGKPDLVYSDNQGTVSFMHNKPLAAAPVVAAPVITSFTPTTALNGDKIVINGADFNGSAAADVVYLGATQAKVVTASSSQLTVQIPKGTTYAPLSVLNKTNGLQAASVNPFVNKFKSSGIIDTTSFKSDTTLSGQWNPGASAIGDIDGDGKPDIVFSQTPGNLYKLAVSRNTTKIVDTIAFAPYIEYDLPTYAGSVVLADIDGDGKLDVVVNYLGSDFDSFSIFRNTSTPGKISFAPRFDVHFYSTAIAIGDLNGDGKPDIVALGEPNYRADLANHFYTFSNTSTPGNISFASPDIFSTVSGVVAGITDVDGDGKPDVVISSVLSDNVNITHAVFVYRNISASGGTSFLSGIKFAMGGGTSVLKIGDLDGDGKPDLVTCDVYNTTAISVLNNTSTPGKIAFKSHQEITAPSINAITLGDVNGDGKADLLATGFSSNAIAIYKNKSTPGKIAFGSNVTIKPFGVVYPQFVSIGDLNGDGKADLAVSCNYTSCCNGNYSSFILLKNNIQIVPVPTITANGPLTFAQGKNVILTAHPDTGFTYQWLLDGVKIKNATTPTLTAAKSGNYTVTISLDTISKTSLATVVNVMFTLPIDNFKLTITSATCKGSNNGSIAITAKQSMSYTATITGSGLNKAYPFTTTQNIPDLAAGSYSVCITVAGQPDYQQCFDAVITEPKDLSLYSTVNDADNTITLSLSGGTQYNIKLNGNNYTTTDNSITLPLNEGNNELEVTTDKLCQGLIQKLINYSTKIAPYPVPFENTLSVNLGNGNIGSVSLTINNAGDGKAVFSKQYVNQSGVLQIDVSALKAGVYGLHLTMGSTEKVFKILKK